jgi:hypothetical protein
MPLNLSLPHQAPELGLYGDCNLDDAAFAVFTLIGDKTPPQDVASALEKQWLEQGNEYHLARPAAPVAELMTLRDAVRAHIALDKGKRERSDGSTAGDLEWWPTAFVVVVRKDWRDNAGGLLFVFANEEKGYELDMFFFKLEDAYMTLSSLSFGDEYLARSKAIYGQEAST